MTALAALGLTKFYGSSRRPALDGIDLAIEEGSAVALVGPNGAGKSTLIRTFLGFERPTRGRVEVAGIDVGRRRTDAVRQLGYVGQTPGLYRELPAEAHFALACALRSAFDAGIARARLAELRIPADWPVGRLSGGQQAQIALALAIGTRAPILLLDEPLASLDPLARREFLGQVAREVRERRTTLLLASHIIGALTTVCDRLVVLGSARILLDAPMADVRSRYVVTPPFTSIDGQRIAVFPDEVGTPQILWRTPDPADNPASLDDVVLGYLAASRLADESAA